MYLEGSDESVWFESVYIPINLPGASPSWLVANVVSHSLSVTSYVLPLTYEAVLANLI